MQSVPHLLLHVLLRLVHLLPLLLLLHLHVHRVHAMSLSVLAIAEDVPRDHQRLEDIAGIGPQVIISSSSRRHSCTSAAAHTCAWRMHVLPHECMLPRVVIVVVQEMAKRNEQVGDQRGISQQGTTTDATSSSCRCRCVACPPVDCRGQLVLGVRRAETHGCGQVRLPLALAAALLLRVHRGGMCHLAAPAGLAQTREAGA